MDAANTGEWESCVAVQDTGLPDYWANRAYIGVTATTGALADNHDVISLKTYSDQAVLDADERNEKVCALFHLPRTMPFAELNADTCSCLLTCICF